MPRSATQVLRKRVNADPSLTSTSDGAWVNNSIRMDTISSTATASVVSGDDSSESLPSSELSVAVIIQIFIVIALLIGLFIFFFTRKPRHRRDRQRDVERSANTVFFGDISAPNGLGGHRSSAPSYYEAIKSPAASVELAPGQKMGHSRQTSNSMLMDDCWKAVYAAEDGLSANGSPGHSRGSSSTSNIPGIVEPTSPRGVAKGDKRQSVSRWLRNQRRSTSNASGPLSSNPSADTQKPTGIPVPPSPSYTGIPSTPSVPHTPMTATYLPTTPSYPEPMSARSWVTGDDRLSSVQSSIFQETLYPTPLQPVPIPRRLDTISTNRDSVSSLQLYGSETWKTMTPHEDPPQYRPSRGDPDTVSPI